MFNIYLLNKDSSLSLNFYFMSIYLLLFLILYFTILLKKFVYYNEIK